MKSLKESLFDSDLIQRKIGALSIITSELAQYIHKDKRGSWNPVALKIKKDIKYDERKGYPILDSPIKPNNLYVSIQGSYWGVELTLLGKGLDGTDDISLIVIRYDKYIKNIYADVNKPGTVAYRSAINNRDFNLFKMDKSEIGNFVNNAFDQMRQVF